QGRGVCGSGRRPADVLPSDRRPAPGDRARGHAQRRQASDSPLRSLIRSRRIPMAAAELDDIGREVLHGMYRRAGYPPVDFDRFHRVELPKKLREGGSDAVHWDVVGARPLAIVLPGERSYSFVSRPDRIEVVAGVASDAETVIEMSEEAWIDY